MPVWLTTQATQAFGTTTAAARIRVDSLVFKDPPEVVLEQGFDGSAVLIQPSLQLIGQPPGTTVDHVLVEPSWTVGGSETAALRTGNLTVGSDLEGCARTWEQPVIASTGSTTTADFAVGPLGYEVQTAGPPPGKGVPIDFSLTLNGTGDLTGTSTDLAVLTGGVVQRSKRSWNGEEHVMVLSGSGSWATYADLEVQLRLEPDHGLTQGQVVILLMEAAGVPEELIGIDPALGSPRTLPQDITCVGLRQICKEILEPIGYVPMADRTTGAFVARAMFVEDTPVMTITARDIVMDSSTGIEIESDNTTPTCVHVEGRRLEDTGKGPGSGIVTTIVFVRTIDPAFVNEIAQAVQDTGGVISPTGFGTPAPVANVVTSETEVRTTTDNGCLTQTHTIVRGFFKPQSARYAASESPDGLPNLYPSNNVYFYDVTPVADDSTEGFQWVQPRFVTISETIVRPEYNSELTQVGSSISTNGWSNRIRRIKSRGAADNPWEDQDYETGFLSAARVGLVFANEQYFAGDPVGDGIPDDLLPSGTNPLYPGIRVTNRHAQVVVTVDELDECDQILSTQTSTTKYGRRSGTLNLYTDGEFRTEHEVGVTSTTAEVRVTSGGRTQSVITARDSDGNVLPGPAPTVVDGLEAAVKCTDEVLLKDTEEKFEVEVCIALADGSLDRSKPTDVNSRWVETVAEATFWGNIILDFLRGYPLTLTMSSPAPVIDAGDTVEVDITQFLPEVTSCKVLETSTTVPVARGNDPVVHELKLLIPP